MSEFEETVKYLEGLKENGSYSVFWPFLKLKNKTELFFKQFIPSFGIKGTKFFVEIDNKHYLITFEEVKLNE